MCTRTRGLLVAETKLSTSLNAESRLWNHATQQLRAWERALQSPAHFKHLPPAEFTPTQHTEKRRQVKAYNWAIARALQRNGEKALIGAIQGLEGWSEAYHRSCRAAGHGPGGVWHAAHKGMQAGGTTSWKESIEGRLVLLSEQSSS